jgi:hypothetical protein
MRESFIMWQTFDGRFRQAVERRLREGQALFTTAELTALAADLMEERRQQTLAKRLESSDIVHIDNFALKHDGDRWRVSKEWDFQEAIAKCQPLSEELIRSTGKEAMDLESESDRKMLWDCWQDYHTRTIQSDPNWREYWLPEHFPLEAYKPDKAATACERLAERFGPKPRCTGELIFWFMAIAEGMQP